MKEYKGINFPDLNDALNFYQVPGQTGGFNKDERNCPNLLIKLPKSGITLSIDNVNKNELMELMAKYGHIPESKKIEVEKQIDGVCMNYIDAITSGDLAI